MADITRHDAEALVASIGIPPRPAVVLTVIEEKSKETPDTRAVIGAISRDVGVSAALLKTVNSPLFGLRVQVASIPHAVSLLGMNRIATLVNSLALKTSLNAQGIERFWDQSARTAMASAWLARKMGHDVDSAHLFGLFRDAGIPLLMKRFPDYKDTLRLANQSGTDSFTDIEDRRHGMNHAIIGSILARNWCLPDVVHEAVRRHHDPDVFRSDTPDGVKTLVALSHLAGQIESAHARNTDDPEWLRFAPSAMAWLMLDEPDVAELTEEVGSLLLESCA
jgi:HD-like signal output (HDOD) protein